MPSLLQEGTRRGVPLQRRTGTHDCVFTREDTEDGSPFSQMCTIGPRHEMQVKNTFIDLPVKADEEDDGGAVPAPPRLFHHHTDTGVYTSLVGVDDGHAEDASTTASVGRDNLGCSHDDVAETSSSCGNTINAAPAVERTCSMPNHTQEGTGHGAPLQRRTTHDCAFGSDDIEDANPVTQMRNLGHRHEMQVKNTFIDVKTEEDDDGAVPAPPRLIHHHTDTGVYTGALLVDHDGEASTTGSVGRMSSDAQTDRESPSAQRTPCSEERMPTDQQDDPGCSPATDQRRLVRTTSPQDLDVDMDDSDAPGGEEVTSTPFAAQAYANNHSQAETPASGRCFMPTPAGVLNQTMHWAYGLGMCYPPPFVLCPAPVTPWHFSEAPPASASPKSKRPARRPRGSASHKGQRTAAEKHSDRVTDGEAATNQYTTVMFLKLPYAYDREMLKKLLDDEGLADYDFLYLPIDLRRGCGLGYAHVNFVSHEAALRAREKLRGHSSWHVEAGADRVLEFGWGHREFQGKEKNVQRYRDCPIRHSTIPDQYLPALYNAKGERVHFPEPTKVIKAPRIKGRKNSRAVDGVTPWQ